MSPSWNGYLYSLSKKELVMRLIILFEAVCHGQEKSEPVIIYQPDSAGKQLVRI
jgi:hypothetical protein